MQLIVFQTLTLLLGSFAQQISSQTTEESVSTTSQDPSKELFPSPRIVGGSAAKEGQFPYQVSLRINGRHTCGASIISKNYVVTAAHCVKSGGSTISSGVLSIRAGSTRYDQGGAVVSIAEVKPHPNYSFPRNDIALLRLSTSLTFTDNIGAIPIRTSEVPSGSTVVTSGWGFLSTRGTLPQQLQYVNLVALSSGQCRRFSRDQSVLCLAHPAGKGVCQGDSGGPAAYNGTLVGATSFTLGNCGTNLPDGFAKISYLSNWIKQNSDI